MGAPSCLEKAEVERTSCQTDPGTGAHPPLGFNIHTGAFQRTVLLHVPS